MLFRSPCENLRLIFSLWGNSLLMTGSHYHGYALHCKGSETLGIRPTTNPSPLFLVGSPLNSIHPWTLLGHRCFPIGGPCGVVGIVGCCCFLPIHRPTKQGATRSWSQIQRGILRTRTTRATSHCCRRCVGSLCCCCCRSFRSRTPRGGAR